MKLENIVSVYRFVTYYDSIKELSEFFEEWKDDNDFFNREFTDELNIDNNTNT